MGAHEFLEVKFLDGNAEENLQEGYGEISLPFANSELFRAPVINAKLLTRGEDVRRVYEMTISTQDIDYKFRPGDTIGIVPINNHGEVDQILNILQLQELADLPCRLGILQNCKKKNATIPKHLPTSTTVRQLFLKYLDIRSPPKKAFLRILRDSASSESDKEKLDHICSPNGSNAYFNLISNEGKDLLGLFKMFPSCRCPVARLLEHLPPIKPRPYSISSSPLIPDKSIKFTFSVVHHEDGSEGVCSGYLARIAEKIATRQYLCFYFRKPTKFQLPEDDSTPIIMIGPGTGIAPFIGFLQHRNILKNNEGAIFGKTWLFFGCRYSNRDYLFKNELEHYLRSGVLNELFVSFSRESDKKFYVQHNMEKQGSAFCDLVVNANAIIYVCGDAKNMMKDVKKVVVDIMVRHGEKTRAEAETFIKELESNGKYIEDAWL